LGLVTIFFRSDQFWLALLFSLHSFVRALLLAYGWLLAVCVINRHSTTPDSVLKFLRQLLGRPAGWPIYLQVPLPLLFCVAVWPGLHLPLTHAGVTSAVPPAGRLLLQGGLLGLAACFSLKYLIVSLLLVDFLSSYIYFGRSRVWDCLSATARNLLGPLQRLPLRRGRMDFAPLVGIGLTLLLLHWLPRLVEFGLNRRNLTLWPQ
jgi:uncharacterized protein YggT (Ycf19 family)